MTPKPPSPPGSAPPGPTVVVSVGGVVLCGAAVHSFLAVVHQVGGGGGPGVGKPWVVPHAPGHHARPRRKPGQGYSYVMSILWDSWVFIMILCFLELSNFWLLLFYVIFGILAKNVNIYIYMSIYMSIYL